jgi:hypothetical protein
MGHLEFPLERHPTISGLIVLGATCVQTLTIPRKGIRAHGFMLTFCSHPQNCAKRSETIHRDYEHALNFSMQQTTTRSKTVYADYKRL